MNIRYKATTAEGELYTKDIEIESKAALYELLRSKGETLVSIEGSDVSGEAGDGVLKRISARVEVFTTRIKEHDKILFARNLGAMIEAGLPVSRALDVIERQSSNKKFSAVIADLQDLIRQGNSLHEALEHHSDVFPPLFISMVEAGEESGSLAKSLKIVADQMERSYKLKKKVKGAMIYPSVILGAMVIITILMMIFVVPTLTATFKDLNVDLPTSTKIVIAVSDFMANYTLIALGVIILLVVGAVAAFKSKRGQKVFHFVSLRVPVIGKLVVETNAAQTTSTLSSLLGSGVEVVHAIHITGHVVQNQYYRKVLKELEEEIQKGAVMSKVFGRYPKLYPAFVSEMAMVGEETGRLPELLNRVATFYEDDVSQKTKDLSTIIEPVLMIVIGAAVGFFAVSMITPMYSLTSTL